VAKNQAAAELGRLGAKATNAKLSPEQRRSNARRAAMTRWAKVAESARVLSAARKEATA